MNTLKIENQIAERFRYKPLSKSLSKKGQEYRIYDEKYCNTAKYQWFSIDDKSNIKIYYQQHTIKYADYLPNMYYVSVHEVSI